MITTVEMIIFTLVFLGGMGLFVWGVYDKVRILQKMQPYQLKGNHLQRTWEAIKRVFLQTKLVERPIQGIAHVFIIWGFIFYVPITITHFIKAYVPEFHLPGLATSILGSAQPGSIGDYHKLIVDIFSVLVLLGLTWFAIRRWVIKAEGLKDKEKKDGEAYDHGAGVQSAIVIGFIAVLMISYLMTEGFEVAAASSNIIDKMKSFEPVSYIFASMVRNTDSGTVNILFHIAWWLHTLAILGFAAYVPNSKHMHLLFCPPNEYIGQYEFGKKGSPRHIDLEDEDALWGFSKITDFNWNQMLDSFACIECGRCQDVCPAYNTNKPLSPKQLLVKTKTHVLDKEVKQKILAQGTDDAPELPDLIGEVIPEEMLWSCTTCMACTEACPVGNEHPLKFVEMRRTIVLEGMPFSKELQLAFENLEKNSNPWGIGSDRRMDWAEGLDIKTLAEDKDVDILYFVGCAGAYDDGYKQVARKFVQILQKAGVKVGVLGLEEGCCGDTARRGGNEYLYQMLAEANIETMNNYGVKKIVTTCPHGYNIIKKEYPEMGGNYEVYHSTEYLLKLIEEGKIKLDNKIKGTFTYHDSCYLGRYNEIYNQPRNILEKMVDGSIVEMEHNKKRSFCCGAGGARMWMEEETPRMNSVRSDEALAVNATNVAVACPFCKTMISDGMKEKEREDVKVEDLVELIAQAMGIS